MDSKEQARREQIMETLPTPDDSWAKVELYRWQHGELPSEENEKPLHIAEGLRGMAAAFRTGKSEDFPSPFNVMAVLEYTASVLDEKNIEEKSGPEKPNRQKAPKSKAKVPRRRSRRPGK